MVNNEQSNKINANKGELSDAAKGISSSNFNGYWSGGAHDNLTSKLDSAMSVFDAQIASIGNFYQDVKKVEECKEIDEQVKEKEGEIKDKEGEISRLEADIETRKENKDDYGDLEAEITKLEGEIEKLQKEIDELKEKKENLKSEAKSLLGDISSISAQGSVI